MSFFNPVSFVANIVVSGFARSEVYRARPKPTAEYIASERIKLLRRFRPDLAGTPQERQLLGQSTRSAPVLQEVTMSMLGDIGRAIAPAIGGWLGGYTPIGGTAGAALGTEVARLSAQRSNVMMPGVGPIGPQPTMASLPRIVGGAAGMVAGAAVLGARTVARSAITYCRRHPAWCAQIGGTAAIAAMISDGTLPPIKRRRARGITASQFRGFRRVHSVLSGFCAPRMRIRRGRK